MNWVVYLIESGDGGPIKIGHARDAYSRLCALQTGNPQKLRLVEYAEAGSQAQASAIERKVQAACADFHIRGEWYQREAIDIAKPILSEVQPRRHREGISASIERTPGEPLPRTADDIEWQVKRLLDCPELRAEFSTDRAIANLLGAPAWLVRFSRAAWESSAAQNEVAD